MKLIFGNMICLCKICFLFALVFSCNYTFSNLLAHKSSKNAKSGNILKYSQTRLKNLSHRHKILSENIANVNTPLYKGKDLLINDKSYSKNKLTPFKLRTTSKMHFQGKTIGNELVNIVHNKSFEQKLNGNNVSLNEEIPKLSQNTQDYNSTLKIYSSLNQLLSTAISNNK